MRVRVFIFLAVSILSTLPRCGESRNAGNNESVPSKTSQAADEKEELIEGSFPPIKSGEHFECEIKSLPWEEENSASITFYKVSENKRCEIVKFISRTYLTYSQQIGNNIYFNRRKHSDGQNREDLHFVDGGDLYLFDGTEGVIKNMHIAITDGFTIDDNEKYICYVTKAETKLLKVSNLMGKSFMEVYKPGIAIVELGTRKKREFTFDNSFDFDLFALRIVIKYNNKENRFELAFYADSPQSMGAGFIDLSDAVFSFTKMSEISK
jgi:hypothetical protein